MKNCNNLYLLSTLACQITDCLSEKEAGVLAADLATISCMISAILARDIASAIDSSADSDIALQVEESFF